MKKPIARLLTWKGPRHYPVPHGGVAARTYAEFPEENGDDPHAYWKNAEPLYPKSDYDALAAERDRLALEARQASAAWAEDCREKERLAKELALLHGDRHPGYVIGQHWMTSAYQRLCAGEGEAEVMADYGYQRAAANETGRQP